MTDSDVRLIEVAAQPTVVVARATTWRAFPTLWRPLLDEVYAAVKAVAAEGPQDRWRNVMLYKDDIPNVEVGVLGHWPHADAANVVESTLPGGVVAVSTHRGPYAQLDVAHRAICEWCAARGRALAGPRWEIYGHWRADPNELETEVHYLLE